QVRVRLEAGRSPRVDRRAHESAFQAKLPLVTPRVLGDSRDRAHHHHHDYGSSHDILQEGLGIAALDDASRSRRVMKPSGNPYDSLMSTVQIGRWTANPSDGTLTSATGIVRLEPKVMAVLMFLVERRGALVTHAELLDGVWPDAHVAPGAL